MRNSRLLLILLCVLPLAAQTSAKPASVRGTVTNSVTGLPIPRAHVTLQGAFDGKGVLYGATSGADGRFSFTGITPGPYVAEADRIGFVRNLSPLPSDRNTVQLGPDDNKTGVEIRLTPTGSITGRVTDSDGEPVENLFVQAQGARGGSSGMTDDKGEYRVGGLSPGKYTIRTSTSGDFLGGPPEIRTDGTTEAHNAATYYPGVLTSKEAGKIDVRPGAETPGADIRLVQVPFVRVSGRVVDMPADAHPDIMIREGHSGTGTAMKRDGTFVLWRLDPGKYTLSANWQAPNGDRVRTVGVPIEVAGSNIDNIELRVVPGSDISGRLEFEDDEAKQIPKHDDPDRGDDEPRIELTGGGFGEGEAGATIDANGAFQLKKVAAGKYRVMVSWGSDYIKSVRLGSTTIDGATLDLMRGSGGADLSVLMAAANSSISGTVQDANGPATRATVVLVPASQDEAEDIDEFMGLDDAKYSGTKPDGSYSFDHVAPGDYQIVAVPENDWSLQGNRVIGYEDQMETVTVGPKDKITKDLKRREPTPQ